MKKYFFLGCVAVFLTACSSKPMPEAFKALQQAQENDEYYLFEADQPVTDSCYIFYPGGLVNAEAYAPYAAAVAAKGAHTFLLRLDLDLAMYDADAPDDAKQSDFARQHCKRYVLGGHSLGGLGMFKYAETHPEDAIIFISAYAHEDTVVKSHPSPVMVIHGSNDPLSSAEEIEESKGNLPANTQYVSIEGGNHAQMGYYGPQKRDGTASITREEQHRQLVNHTMDAIFSMDSVSE